MHFSHVRLEPLRLLRLLRRRVCQRLPQDPVTVGRPRVGARSVAVVRLVEPGEASVVPLASTPPSSLLRGSVRRQLPRKTAILPRGSGSPAGSNVHFSPRRPRRACRASSPSASVRHVCFSCSSSCSSSRPPARPRTALPMRKLCMHLWLNGASKQLRTFLPGARDCGHGGRPFAPQMKALAETRLAVPNMRGNAPGREGCRRPKCKDRCRSCIGHSRAACGARQACAGARGHRPDTPDGP